MSSLLARAWMHNSIAFALAQICLRRIWEFARLRAFDLQEFFGRFQPRRQWPRLLMLLAREIS